MYVRAGTVNGQAIVVFRNAKKAPGSKGPDWRILKPTPKPNPRAVDDEIGF